MAFFGALLLLCAVYFYCCYWPRRRWKNMKTFDRKQETDKAFLRCCPRSPCLFLRPCPSLCPFLPRLVSFALGAFSAFLQRVASLSCPANLLCEIYFTARKYGEATRTTEIHKNTPRVAINLGHFYTILLSCHISNC